MKQLNLDIYKGKNGGPRPGAGRPRIHSKGVSHAKREKVTKTFPVHINFKYILPIRSKETLNIVQEALRRLNQFGLHIAVYSIQYNHIHLIAEVNDNKSLSSGMRSLTNTLIKRLDKGAIQVERYHLHVLKTPMEVKHALNYVLTNDIKHCRRQSSYFTRTVSRGNSWLLKNAFTTL